MNVIKYRRSESVSLGDAGNEKLQRAMRGQANLSEYAPMGLLLILLAELQNANGIALMILAALFVVGRLLHGYAFGIVEKSIFGRYWGMMATFIGIAGLAVLNIFNLVIA